MSSWPRLLPGLLAAAGFLWGGMSSSPVAASTAPPASLDCAVLPCRDVLPSAVTFGPAERGKHWVGRDGGGEIVGWVALSTDFVSIKAYSGKPLVTLVGLDRAGTITGAAVVHHSEPILLVGIPESRLTDFVAAYAGKRATERIVVGRSARPGAVEIDAISGATVTVLAQNHTILEVARKLGVEVGVIDAASISPGRFVSEPQPWTFAEMLQRGALGRLTVSEADMGVSESTAPFIDLYFTIADAPHIGRALIRPGDYAYYMGQLEEGEHLVVVLGDGSGSFKGSAFVRGGVFDRIRLEQGLREIHFRDTDYHNLSDIPAIGAPGFREGAVFIARGGLLDPGAPYDLIFLGSRYDQRGAFSREFHEFRATHTLPSRVYELDRSASATVWQQAWINRRTESIVLVAFLLLVSGTFVARRFTTASPRRLGRLHVASMVVSFILLGLIMHAQPSVTQILTLVDSILGDWNWQLFASEPLLFICWIFIAVTALVWGRGVFCGWVCPYGAMTELLFKISSKLGVRSYELPDAWHTRLRYLRYGILVVLLLVFLRDSVLGEKLAEVEPFKSTFLVPAWRREAGFFGWWLLLIGASTVMYRPFCRYLCPLGAGLAIFGSFRVSGPRRRRFCSSCKICKRGCEPRAIRSDGTIDPRECLSCMECEANYRDVTVCPPLIAVQQLEAHGNLTAAQQRKMLKLKVQRERV